MRAFATGLAGLLLAAALWAGMVTAVRASHNLAGQISCTRIGENTYEIVLTTYTDPTLFGVDLCTVDLEIFGVQGETAVLLDKLNGIPRENGDFGSCTAPARMGVRLRRYRYGIVKKNIYRATYRFAGPGVYEIRFWNPNRIFNVDNMTNSGATTFYVETRIFNNPFVGQNSSPILLNDPVDDACTFRLWSHNPGAYDPDGDSLVHSLIPNRQYNPVSPYNINDPIEVANYRYPGDFGGAFRIDPSTGLITWDTPQRPGIYNIAILIEEYRNGRRIGYVVRDMAIFVDVCRNRPPIIEAPRDTCVRPGERLRFDVVVYDPDSLSVPQWPGEPPPDSFYVYLKNGAFEDDDAVPPANGPFAVSFKPATIIPNIGFDDFPLKEKMRDRVRFTVDWDVDCAHIRSQHYQIDLYAHDNLVHEKTLAANHVVKIRVVPGGPLGISAEAGSRRITVRWDPPPCADSVRQYEIYRSETADGEEFLDTTCCTGFNGAQDEWGYRRIGAVSGREFEFVDDDNGRGLAFRARYCYRVLAVYPGGVRSCASPDTCLRILRDMPILTRNTIDRTDGADGVLTVAWLPPDFSRISSDFFPPPYSYGLFGAPGQNTGPLQPAGPQQPDDQPTARAFGGLNTEGNAYRYQARLYDAAGEEVGVSDTATSVFLQGQAAQGLAVRLFWQERTPWFNNIYAVWRKGPGEAEFSEVARFDENPARVAENSRLAHTYLDQGLIVDETYCYYIESVGDYELDPASAPSDVIAQTKNLINYSNEICVVVRDLEPPCLPYPDSITANSDCLNFRNTFGWIRRYDFCDFDLKEFRLYYSEAPGGPYTLAAVTDSATQTSLVDPQTVQRQAARGCYVLTAVDSTGNESEYTEEFCFDNCPVIQLPNVFTPNGDGVNDVFRAILPQNVLEAECFIYDRWGVLIATSRDIALLWDGQTQNGARAPAGQYFYFIRITLDNNERTVLERGGSVSVLY